MRCKIVYTKLLDSIEIEEYIELINKLLTVLWEQDKTAFTEIMKNMSLTKVKDLSSSIIKGILFKFYILINDKQAYNNINKWSKEYLQKINAGISKEGYIMHKRWLVLEEWFVPERTNGNEYS